MSGGSTLMPATGPLAPIDAGFRLHLAELGYAAGSIENHMRVLRQLDAWMAGEGLDLVGLTRTAVGRFCDQRRLVASPPVVTPLLGYLDAAGVLVAGEIEMSEAEKLVAEFGDYLLAERGLAAGTVRLYQGVAGLFLAQCSEPIRDGLARLDAFTVDAFVVAECRRRGIASAKSMVGGLRALLKFAYLNGWTPRPLASVVPAVADRSGGSLPRGLDPADVARLLSSCARDTAVGARDFAILTVLARLGLRSNEVALLELSDVDWRAGEIQVRGKGNRLERLPVPRDVGDALVDYLRRGRPRALCRQLFLRSCAPPTALSSTAVSAVVRAACRRAGVTPVGAHCLRHSVAAELLRRGAPLAEIGQLLRHKHAATTAIYAKVDRGALTGLALEWPGGRS